MTILAFISLPVCAAMIAPELALGPVQPVILERNPLCGTTS